MSFVLREFTAILKGGLAARCKLQMPSGLILACLILRQKKDPDTFFITPVSEKLHGGGYAPVVEFSSPELQRTWQDMAMAAIEPRLQELRTKIEDPRADPEDAFNSAPF